MDIRPGGIPGGGASPIREAQKSASGGKRSSFDSTIGKFLNEVSDLQKDVDASVQRMASGGPEEVHQMLLTVNKAELSFRLMIELRNKLLEAYQEVMRTPT